MTGGKLWSILRDYIVLSGLLMMANAVLARDDTGLLLWNPTPWLLPAVLLGARYGFNAGWSCGAVTAALISAARWRLTGAHDPLNVLHEHAWPLLCIIIAGALAGELRHYIRRHAARLEAENRALHSEVEQLSTQLDVARETRHQLQARLAVHNAPMAGFDDELKKLFHTTEEHFPDEMLNSLHTLADVASAGLYFSDGRQLTAAARLHPTAPLTESLPLNKTPLAQMALSTAQLAAVSDAAQLTEEQPFLAALPWASPDGKDAVVLIQDMPLESFTLHHLARVELILTWSAAMAGLRRQFAKKASADRVVAREVFIAVLDEAAKAEQTHGLPSAVMRINSTGADLKTLMPILPSHAIATRMDDDGSLVVLLPFSGEPEAGDLTRQLMATSAAIRTEHYLISGTTNGAELWRRITQN